MAGDDVVAIVGINNATEATTYTTVPSGFANSALLDNGGNFNPDLAIADKVGVGGEPDNLGGHTEKRVRPVVRACAPGSVLELPDDEAERLIALGSARKYEPPPPAPAAA